MELRQYARILVRRLPIIMLLAAFGAGSAYAFAAGSPRLYRATAHLSVTPSTIDFFTGEAVQRLMNNYALRLRSNAFAAEFAPRVSLAARGDDVNGKVRAVAAPQEYRISVEVDDPDPARAQQIANAAAYGFVEKIRSESKSRSNQEKQDIYLEVFEPAGVPGAPFSPRPRRDALGGALIGAIIAGALVLLLEALDDTVKSAAEAQGLLGLQLLGSIPNSKRTGVLNGVIRRSTGPRYPL